MAEVINLVCHNGTSNIGVPKYDSMSFDPYIKSDKKAFLEVNFSGSNNQFNNFAPLQHLQFTCYNECLNECSRVAW